MSVRKLFVVSIFCIFCGQTFAASPDAEIRRTEALMTAVAGVGIAAGWAFYCARGAPWGRKALAGFLAANTASWCDKASHIWEKGSGK